MLQLFLDVVPLEIHFLTKTLGFLSNIATKGFTNTLSRVMN